MTRRHWLLASAGISVSRAFAANEPLAVSWDGDNLHVAAPHLRFLTGKPLQRLKDGASVLYMTQLSLSADNWATILRRVPDRFVVSYDLWEEKFSVTKLAGRPATASHLSASAAELWCLDSLAISISGLSPSGLFRLRLDLRVADPKEEAVVSESGISLTRLIEIFSRQPRSQQPQWTCESGPLRLADLRRLQGRGSRIG